ncbi:MAG: elongation factor P, partial [Lachnospira sp.]|nr:elongation factor P [Lachnospira sp.]
MVSAGDFKNGITVKMDNGIWQIIEFQHVKPGKGAAFVRTKMKNIVSGGVVEKTFRPTKNLALAHIERKDYRHYYSDGDVYNLM